MSVINQMLKDIDNRKRESQSPVAGILPSNNYVSGQQISLVKILSLILLIIVLVILVTSVVIYKFEIFKPDAPHILQPVPKASSQVNTQQQLVIEQAANDELLISENPTSESPTSENTAAETIIVQPTISETSVIDSKTESITLGSTIPVTIVPESKQDTLDQATTIIKTPHKVSASVQAEAFVKKARTEMARGNLLAAKSLLNQSLELNANNHQARVLLLSVLLKLTHLEEMQTLLSTSLSQWSEVTEYRQMQARLYLQQGKQALAFTALDNDIPPVSNSPDYHALLAYIAQQLKKDSLASHHYQLLLQFNNSRADWWLGLAVSEERVGNVSIALEAYNQSISQIGLSESVKNYARLRIKAIQGY